MVFRWREHETAVRKHGLGRMDVSATFLVHPGTACFPVRSVFCRAAFSVARTALFTLVV